MKQNETSKKYNRINDFIRCEMRKKKISQEAAANYLGLRQDGISRRLSGKPEWTFREILSLYDLLEVELWQKRKSDK